MENRINLVISLEPEPAEPVQIIYSGTTTICVFPDGEKQISRPSEEDNFDPEVGVAMCIMRRIYGSRSAFLKAVENGYRQDKKGK